MPKKGKRGRVLVRGVGGEKEEHGLAPLVDVRGDRIGGALRASGLAHREVARMLNSSPGKYGLRHKIVPQTIDYIVSGQQQRCREDLVGALAHVTDLPAEWLRGEMNHLPYVPAWQEATENQRAFKARPASTYIRQWRFVRQCLRAAARDLRREFPSPESAALAWAKVEPRVAEWFVALTDPERHMHWLVGWGGLGAPSSVDDGTDVTGPLVEGLVAAWGWALGPWFRDERPLDYKALSYLATTKVLVAPDGGSNPSYLLQAPALLDLSASA